MSLLFIIPCFYEILFVWDFSVNYNIAPVTHYGGNQGHNTIITSQSRSYNEAQPAMVRSSQTQYAVMQRSSAQVPPGTFTMVFL